MDLSRENHLVYFSVFFVLFILIEAWIAYRQGRELYQGKDTWANIFVGLGSLVVGTLSLGGMLVIFEFFYRLTPLRLELHWWGYLLTVIVVDFCHYWAHRFSHVVRFGWASHVVHHSSEKFNLSVAIRQPWTHHWLFIFFIPVVLMGVPPEAALAAKTFNSLFQFWVHTQYIGKLWAPIEFVFNTPSHHRVHHGSNPKYLDKNYAGIFIIWDRLFGSYAEEEEPVTYGITHNIKTFNPIKINFHEYVDLIKDMAHAKSFADAWGYFIHKPGWQPQPKAETTQVEEDTDLQDMPTLAGNNAN